MNPLLIYFLLNTHLVDFRYIASFFLGFSWTNASPPMADVWQALAMMAVEFALLYWLYRRRFFWRV